MTCKFAMIWGHNWSYLAITRHIISLWTISGHLNTYSATYFDPNMIKYD